MIGVIAYGWMCRYALAAREEVGVGIVTALRGALGPAMRTSWFAVPAFAATAIGMMLVVPGLVLIAVLGTLPFPFLAKVPQPAVQHFRLVGRFGGQVIAVGALAVLVAIPFWAVAVTASFLTEAYDGLAELMSWPLAWARFVLVALVTAWAASAFAFLYATSISISNTSG